MPSLQVILTLMGAYSSCVRKQKMLLNLCHHMTSHDYPNQNVQLAANCSFST